jgi:hypothetical protein
MHVGTPDAINEAEKAISESMKIGSALPGAD